MKMIILAAGKGTRLWPLTKNKPKCMVEYMGKCIIDSLLETALVCNIDSIALVNGYKSDVLREYLKKYKIKIYTNERFETTNMVSSLFCAKDFLDDDLIISYSDIVYSKEILQKFIDSNVDFGVIVDKNWRELWDQRMENPIMDVETLKIKNDCIIEIGKRPRNYEEIEGQYIGLIKISKSALRKVIDFYNKLDKDKIYDGKDYDNMYMTSFIQLVIDNLMDVRPIFIEGGWAEIDTIDDLKVKI